MQFIIDIDKLRNAVAKVLPCVSAKPAIPVLNHILFEVKENLLYLTSTDINMSMRTHVSLGDETAVDGALCVSGKYLASILAKMPSGEVFIFVGSNNVFHLEQDTIKYDILGISDLEFPKFLLSEENEYQDIPASDLYRLLNSVLFACSSDETRLALGGVYLAKIDDQIISVSTDGRRLAIVEKNFAWDIKDFEALIPLRTVSTMLKILKNHDDELLVRLGSYDNHMSLEVRNTVFLSKQIDAKYPNYNQVVPAEDSYAYEFDLPVQ
ncbi:MAG: DNA polymerase III subunit beta, partial [Endozoicomonas sp.]